MPTRQGRDIYIASHGTGAFNIASAPRGVRIISGISTPAATTGAKAISSRIGCRSTVRALAGLGLQTGGLAAANSRLWGELSNGRAELEGLSAVCRADTPRCQLSVGGALVFDSTPAIDTSVNIYNGKTGTAAQAGYPVEYNGSVYQLSTDTTNSNLQLSTLPSDLSSYSNTAVFSTGSVIDGVTVTVSHLAEGQMDIDSAGGKHVLTMGGTDAFYWRESTGLKYALAARVSTYPMANTTDIIMYVESATVVHFIYLTTWTASGKSYTSPAVITFDGTTWSAPTRFGGSGWMTGGYQCSNMVLYQALSGTPKSVYLSLPTYSTASASNKHMIVWLDLATKTASTAPITTVADSNYLYSPFYREWPPKVVRQNLNSSTLDTAVSFRIGAPNATTQINREQLVGFTYTSGTWKTPTVSGVTLRTDVAGGYNSSAGRFSFGSTEYEVEYYLSQPGASYYWTINAYYWPVGSTGAATFASALL